MVMAGGRRDGVVAGTVVGGTPEEGIIATKCGAQRRRSQALPEVGYSQSRKGTFFAQTFVPEMLTPSQSRQLPKHAESDLLKNGGCD